MESVETCQNNFGCADDDFTLLDRFITFYVVNIALPWHQLTWCKPFSLN